MGISRKNKELTLKLATTNFFKGFWDESWTYIKTVVDVLREPILILDADFRVIAANEPFYATFKVKPKETVGKIVYELGNHQWDIPALRELLEDILPKNSFFKNFEVTNEFPLIGRKQMILNARQIHFNGSTPETFPPIILLAMEDVTAMLAVAEVFAETTSEIEVGRSEQMKKLANQVEKFEKKISELEKRA